jgi:hypothetical protein
MKAAVNAIPPRLVRIALLLALPILMTACGSNSKSPTPSSGVVSGNWQMSLQPINLNQKPKTQAGFLLDNDGTLSGGMMFDDDPCSGVGRVSGTVSASNVSFAVSPTGVEINLMGTVNTSPISMSGSYTMLSTGCSGPHAAPESGTWTASLVTPLNGNLQGAFTSNRLGTPVSMTGQISQGPNTGNSNASITGNVSVSDYCFTSANIVGVVSGTSVVMNLLDSNGTQIGQISGTSTLDGTSIIGLVRIVALGPGGTPPCRNGDSGPVTLTL